MKIIPLADSEDLLIETLKSGGVVVIPTDTIYGLSCRSDCPEAILRIHKFKGSNPKKPLILLASDLLMVEKYSLLTVKQRERAEKLWAEEKPSSLILKQKKAPDEILIPNQDSLAWRLPKSPFLLKIIRALKVPLVSTSFNKTNQPHFKSLVGIQDLLKGEDNLDLLVDGGVLEGEPSRLIDLSGNSEKIIRP